MPESLGDARTTAGLDPARAGLDRLWERGRRFLGTRTAIEFTEKNLRVADALRVIGVRESDVEPRREIVQAVEEGTDLALAGSTRLLALLLRVAAAARSDEGDDRDRGHG